MKTLILLSLATLSSLLFAQSTDYYTWTPDGTAAGAQSGGSGTWDNSSLLWWDGSEAIARGASDYPFGNASLGASTHITFNGTGMITKLGPTYFSDSAASSAGSKNLTHTLNFPAGANYTLSGGIADNAESLSMGNSTGIINVAPTARFTLGGGPGTPIVLAPGYNVSAQHPLKFLGGGEVILDAGAHIIPPSANGRILIDGGTRVTVNEGAHIVGHGATIYDVTTNSQNTRMMLSNGTLTINGGRIVLGYHNTGSPSSARNVGLHLNGTSSNPTVVNMNGGTVTLIGESRADAVNAAGLAFGSNGIFTLSGGNLTVTNIRASSGRAILNLNGGTLAVTTALAPSAHDATLLPTDANLQSRLDTFIDGFRGNGTHYVSIGSAGIRVDTSLIDVTRTNGMAKITSIMQGSGGLTKVGPNGLHLAAANTYTGDTTVEEGTLYVSGSLNGTARINGLGRLSGNGTLKNVVLQGNASLEPRPGMTAATLTWNSSATIRFDLDGAVSGSTLLTIENLQVSGSGPFRMEVANADPEANNITLFTVSGSSGLDPQSLVLIGTSGWTKTISPDGKRIILVNGASTRPLWNNAGGDGNFSTPGNWSPLGKPEDDVRLMIGNNSTLLFDEARNYRASGVEINGGILASFAAAVPASTALYIGAEGLDNNGLGIHFGNLTVITEVPQTWTLKGGSLTFSRIIPRDLLTIDAGSGGTIRFDSPIPENWTGQIYIVGENVSIDLAGTDTLTDEQIARISLNGRALIRSGNSLVIDPAPPADDLPLLHYTFDENGPVYPSEGSIKSPLFAEGANQEPGAMASGVSGEDADRAWDATANAMQGSGGNSQLAHASSLPMMNNLSAFTMSFWYYADQSFNPLRSTLVHKMDGNGGFALRTLYNVTNGIAFNLAIGNTSIASNYFSFPYGIGQSRHWLFVVITWDGSTLQYYYGDKVYPVIGAGSTAFAGPVGGSATPLIIGNTPTGDAPFDGKIDNFRFYDRALGRDELETIRAQEAGPYVSEGRPIRPLGAAHRVLGQTEDEATGLYAPSLLRSSGGRLVAAYTVTAANRKSLSGGTAIAVSDDHGATWTATATVPLIHARIFEVGTQLYLVGHSDTALYISKSSDSGQTWDAPVLLDGGHQWHPSSANVWQDKGYVHFAADRRVMRAADAGGLPLPDIAPILFRAAESADLTNPASWVQASEKSFREIIPGATATTARQKYFGLPFLKAPQVSKSTPYHEKRAQTPMGWQQAQVVRIDDRNHYWDDSSGRTLHLLARAQSGLGEYAAIIKVVDKGAGVLETELESVPSGKNVLFVPHPGGQLPFTIIQDPETKLYWLLGLQPKLDGTSQNRVLYFSTNLVDWCFAALLSKAPGTMEEASLAIDGDDLQILEVQTLNDQTQEVRSYRIEDFRKLFY